MLHVEKHALAKPYSRQKNASTLLPLLSRLGSCSAIPWDSGDMAGCQPYQSCSPHGWHVRFHLPQGTHPPGAEQPRWSLKRCAPTTLTPPGFYGHKSQAGWEWLVTWGWQTRQAGAPRPGERAS